VSHGAASHCTPPLGTRPPALAAQLCTASCGGAQRISRCRVRHNASHTRRRCRLRRLTSGLHPLRCAGVWLAAGGGSAAGDAAAVLRGARRRSLRAVLVSLPSLRRRRGAHLTASPRTLLSVALRLPPAIAPPTPAELAAAGAAAAQAQARYAALQGAAAAAAGAGSGLPMPRDVGGAGFPGFPSPAPPQRPSAAPFAFAPGQATPATPAAPRAAPGPTAHTMVRRHGRGAMANHLKCGD